MEMVIGLLGISFFMTLDVLGIITCVISWNDDDYGMFVFALFWVITLFNCIAFCVLNYLKELFLL